ncbi:hypothetical protein BDA99DRAFT_214071 [Phascolomyces articulosus]|uniref:Uncharacterized protein n=1 Tax=Phascolomyces articulosus TaxID=60185 RepID=A0AAD5JRH4_9FUNG|nr:hypothetical protein BDA99DRAFT_214071 [Phascolomyces articulosus]
MQYRKLPTDDEQSPDPLNPPEYEPRTTTTLTQQYPNNNSITTSTSIPLSSPPSFRSTAPIQHQQQVDLEETFDESIDDTTAESQRLLSSWQQQDTTTSTTNSIHIPTSSSSSSNAATSSHPATLPVPTDGVFSNMSAKPESERDKLDETPPVSCMDHRTTTIILIHKGYSQITTK